MTLDSQWHIIEKENKNGPEVESWIHCRIWMQVQKSSKINEK